MFLERERERECCIWFLMKTLANRDLFLFQFNRRIHSSRIIKAWITYLFRHIEIDRCPVYIFIYVYIYRLNPKLVCWGLLYIYNFLCSSHHFLWLSFFTSAAFCLFVCFLMNLATNFWNFTYPSPWTWLSLPNFKKIENTICSFDSKQILKSFYRRLLKCSQHFSVALYHPCPLADWDGIVGICFAVHIGVVIPDKR